MNFAIYLVLISSCLAFILSKSSLVSKPVKALAAILVVHGFLTSWATYKEVSGYPTTEDVPSKFEINWARVVESSNGKFIELWINYENPPLDKLVSQFSLAHGWNDISRVYRLPYNDKNHEMVVEIQKKIETGKRVGVINENSVTNEELDIRDGMKNYNIEFENRKISK
tara:strand:- start:549 stop:1055 length:507 start_codon:yes stop_codon:yes gene_type:complete